MIGGMVTAAGVAWGVMAVVMAGLWAVQRRTRDAGVVDVGWTYGVGLSAVVLAAAVDGLPARRVLVAALVVLWSLRLGTYILRDRVLKGPEDGRYQDLRKRWRAGFESRILVFFQAQGLLAVLFALPAGAAMLSARPALGLVDLAAVALWLVAIGGETLADRQLAAHRADPAQAGRTCRRGLWRFSRHPNYFFEWLHWVGYSVIAVGWAWWPATLVAPAIMYVLVRYVTGIPPTEAQSVRSRGADYRKYQRTTNAFFPGPPRPDPREAA